VPRVKLAVAKQPTIPNETTPSQSVNDIQGLYTFKMAFVWYATV